MKPSSTPATVEWTPVACIKAHVTMPMGSRISQAAIWRLAAAQLLGHASDLVTRKHYIDKTHAKRPNVSEILKALNEEPGA